MNQHFTKLIGKLVMFFTITALLVPCLNAYASVPRTDIVYFYINVCKSCNEAGKAMDQISSDLKGHHPNIYMYDIENTESLDLLNKYYDHYKVPQNRRQLPCAFVGNSYLAGKDEIASSLKDTVIQMSTPTPLLKNNQPGGKAQMSGAFQLGGTFLTGLVNGFNPCALSMLLFFISLLAAQNSSVLKVGLSFCCGKFLMFFALGTILYRFLSLINPAAYSGSVKALLLAIILVVTALNVSDFFATRKEQYGKVKMQLPSGVRKKMTCFMQQMMRGRAVRYLVLISFITGAVITVGEFLCTGQLYLAAIIYNIREYHGLNMQALLALFIYDTGFLLPLFILVFAIQKGRLLFDISETLRARLPFIKLATAAVFLIYGVIFVFLF